MSIICTLCTPLFNGYEFKNYIKNVTVKLTTVPPYKQRSNGIAENSVKVIKNCLKKAVHEKIESTKLQFFCEFIHLSSTFTSHTVVSKTPANL